MENVRHILENNVNMIWYMCMYSCTQYEYVKKKIDNFPKDSLSGSNQAAKE